MDGESLLMHPGPVLLDPEVVQAMHRPAESHHDSAFYALYDACCESLQVMFGTVGRAIVLPGSGRLGLEAAIVTACRPGDRTLHLVNGAFGGWMAEMARRVGCDVTVLELPWEEPLDPRRVERALVDGGPYRLVSAVHSETSTGQLNPVEAIGPLCRAAGALFLVDAVSSLGVTPIDMDAHAIDLCASASQKGLCAPMGLSAVALGPKAWEELRSGVRGAAPSYALDLMRWEGFWSGGVPRAYPVVPSTHLVRALRQALRQIEAEGLQARFVRHARVAHAVHESVCALGLQPWARVPSPAVTAIVLPADVPGATVVSELARRGILVAEGIGRLAGRVVRVSHMGPQATLGHLATTLRALAEVLLAHGYQCETVPQ